MHQLETWLGDDHNVVVLCAQLSNDGSLRNVDRLKSVATRYQSELRRTALANAKRMYAEKPRNYLRGLKRAVTEWRRRRAGDDRTRAARAAQ